MDSTEMDSIRKTARLAGLLYLLASIPGVYSLMYVPGKLFVKGDAAATAARLRDNPGLLRAGIGAELLATIIFIFVALVLYRLFKPVSPAAALAMMVLIMLSFPISLLNVVNEIAALNLAVGGVGSNFLSVFDAPQRDALAYLFVRVHFQGIMVAQIFW